MKVSHIDLNAEKRFCYGISLQFHHKGDPFIFSVKCLLFLLYKNNKSNKIKNVSLIKYSCLDWLDVIHAYDYYFLVNFSHKILVSQAYLYLNFGNNMEGGL